MSLLAMNSLYKKGRGRVPMVQRIDVNVICYKDYYFPKRIFKLFNSLFHLVCLVFSMRLFPIAVHHM